MSIYITGTGSYIPELIKKNQQFLDNKFLNSDGSQFKVSNDIIIKKFKISSTSFATLSSSVIFSFL